MTLPKMPPEPGRYLTDRVAFIWPEDYNELRSCAESYLATLRIARELLTALLAVPGDHMTACDKTMGDSHACTCGAIKAREALAAMGEP